MDMLVADHQTAFVKGRFIAENFLTTRELLHHVHQTNSPTVLLKLNFAKAYDMLDWGFLAQVLSAKGIPPRMIRWISNLLELATSRLEINGQLSPPFQHSRGLRQGDPLSPYLFILAADALQRMTSNISLASPHTLTAKVPCPIINLQYADDTVFIASIKGSTLRLLMIAIHCFNSASGLKINFQKSSFVPLSIHPTLIGPIETLLQCGRTELPITYLGMPLTLKAPSRNDYAPLLQKMEKRLQGWHARFLSRAGRVQLVRSVLSSIPTYFMSCFQLPGWLVDRMDVMRRNFLWARNGADRSIHLLNWQAVCLPQRCGGMGITNLRLQNMALLLRWLWRIYSPERKLWGNYAVMIHAQRPTPDGPLFLRNTGSFFWRAILKLRSLFHSCVAYQIGWGRNISFWYDSWAGQPLAVDQTRSLNHRLISLYHAKQFPHTLLPTPLTLQQSIAMDMLHQVNFTNGPDYLVWNLSASGEFSVKSVYRVLSQGGRVMSATLSLWKAAVSPSMRLFFYLLINRRVLTHDVMQRRNLTFVPGCVMCARRHPETAHHLFFSCSYAQRIWSSLVVQVGFTIILHGESVQDIYVLSIPRDKELRRRWTTLFITVLWNIWLERNQRTFRDKKSPPLVLLNKIMHQASLCLSHC